MKPTLAELDERDLIGIAMMCAEQAGITNNSLEIMFSRTHKPRPVHARVLFYKYLRDQGWSYPAIGKFVGKDHSTIYKNLENWVDE